eukprot:8303221-Lingulodinium_polyedra.AAC.1
MSSICRNAFCAPCARQKIGVRVERASVQCVRRWSGGRSARPHRCASARKRCAMMRPNRFCVAAADRKSHTRIVHACTVFWRART